MKTIYAIPGEPIALGREGENNALRVVFDLRPWNDLYGPGVVQLVAQRSGEGTPYPVAITTDKFDAIWIVTNADTEIPGREGKAELRYYVGETLAKSAIWTTIVMDALGEPAEAPPEPQQDWVNQVLDAANRAEEAAKKAESSGGGGGDVFVVKITLNEEDQSQNTMDRTFDELSAARSENKVIEAEVRGARYPLSYTESSYIDGSVTKFVFGSMSSAPEDPLLINSRVIQITRDGIERIHNEFYIPEDEGLLRYDEQELTEEEQAQARKNIGAAAVGEGGDSSGFSYEIGHGLKVTNKTTLEVNTVDNFDSDNTLPITAAAVQTIVGNIENILQTI